MTVTTLKKKKTPAAPRYQTFSATAEFEVDADDLHDAGWHHELECSARIAVPRDCADGSGPERLKVTDREAVEELHHQAHGPGSLVLCQSKPCSLLGISQLRAMA